MEKLIGMTDFVLKQFQNVLDNSAESFHKCANYANLLKQPLTLGMFVPCDLEGNVLEEPKEKQCEWCLESHNLTCDDCKKELREYQEAKERVLFEGFEVKRTFIADGTFFDRVEINYLVLFKNYSDKGWHNCSEITYLESLTMLDLRLTPIAQKQIGL